MKRLFDILSALILAVILSPVLVVLMVAIWLEDRGFPFYVSERMRAPERAFFLWKLRTMRVAASDSGVSGGDKEDRITRVGRFLRRTRLDEIPQLWNIFRGDMSFVGPRPPLRQYVEQFPALYAEVLQCRPGVTGLATLVFHAHEEKLLARCTTAEETDRVYARVCVPRKARLDLIYRDHQGFCLDLWILGHTAARFLPRRWRPRRRSAPLRKR